MFVLQMRCQAEDFYVFIFKNEKEEELESNLDIFERMLKFVYLRKIHGLNEVIVDEVCLCVCVYNVYVYIYTYTYMSVYTHIEKNRHLHVHKICVYAHKCINMYMYTHTYKRIHIYICIHKITATGSH